MGEGECESLQEEQPKKSRHRKKHLYNTILQQMEFYFSDSNLTKDRFLSQILSEKSSVDIEIFFKFNKIRKLNCSVEDIQKAIKKSDLIELSEDGTHISRKKPVKVKENVDFCTIYVENIKPDANHESLSQIFSDFGKVVYVSIPKYKHNKANKGFAFIEYETEDQAKEALSFFNSIGCKIPAEKNPEELQSIITFEGDEINTEIGAEKLQGNVEDKETAILDDESGKKRKLSDVEDKNDNKKPKTDLKKDDKDVDKSENANDGGEDTNDDIEDAKKKKKNKKEKRKNYIKDLGMQVLSKKEWKKLRNNYLQLQRKKMKEFKQYLNRQKFGPKTSKKMFEEIIENDDEHHKESEAIIEKAAKLSYSPGVIVKLKLPEPCIDVKKLKNEIKSISSEVKYVDIPLPAGSEEVFVRFGTSEAASEFCNKEFNAEKILLSGHEEKSYWEKIENDRTVKFQKSAKKQRGRDKLLKKAEKMSGKHIKFEDNE